MPTRASRSWRHPPSPTTGLTGLPANCLCGDCGKCTVSVDGRLLAACLIAAALVEGSKVAKVHA